MNPNKYQQARRGGEIENAESGDRQAFKCALGTAYYGRLVRIRDTEYGPIADLDDLAGEHAASGTFKDLGNASVWLPFDAFKKLGQIKPGQSVRFEQVGTKEIPGGKTMHTFKVEPLTLTSAQPFADAQGAAVPAETPAKPAPEGRPAGSHIDDDGGPQAPDDNGFEDIPF